MEIRQLKYFISIAKTRSFSETSRRLFLSQSAISQQIKALEEELDTTLFVRSPHHVNLTESGETLLPLAEQLVRDMQTCEDRMNEISKEPCGELRVGLTYSLDFHIRPTVTHFLKECPKVMLKLYYKSIAELRELLLHNDLDIVLSIDNSEDSSDAILLEPIAEYKLCAIMRDSHPLASRSSLKFKDLERQGIVLPEPSIRDRNAIEHWLHAETGKVNVRAVINDPNALLDLVQSTNMITILSEQVVEGRQNLKALNIEELSTPVTAFMQTLRNGYQKKSASIFMDILRRHSKC